MSKKTNTVFDSENFNAAQYGQHRPVYPDSLFKFLYEFHKRDLRAGFELAVDVATGTGQTAVVLADKFKRVVATDLSEPMLAAAQKHPSVEYKLASAEGFVSDGAVAAGSADLITASTAAHWFDMAAFYKECSRALKPGGTVAIWAYTLFYCEEYPQISNLHAKFALETLKPFWDARRERLDRMYSDADFVPAGYSSFERFEFPKDDPQVAMTKRWSLQTICDYLRTWSAYKTLLEQGVRPDPVDEFAAEMRTVVGADDMQKQITITWPLVLILARP